MLHNCPLLIHTLCIHAKTGHALCLAITLRDMISENELVLAFIFTTAYIIRTIIYAVFLPRDAL